MSRSRGNEKESERARVERQRSRKTTDTESSRASQLTLTDSWQFGQGPQLGLALPGLAWSALALVFGTLDGSQPVYRLIRVAVVVVVIKIKKTFWQLREKQSVKTYRTVPLLLLLPMWNGQHSKREQQLESYRANYAWLERHRMSHIGTVGEWQDCGIFCNYKEASKAVLILSWESSNFYVEFKDLRRNI